MVLVFAATACVGDPAPPVSDAALDVAMEAQVDAANEAAVDAPDDSAPPPPDAQPDVQPDVPPDVPRRPLCDPSRVIDLDMAAMHTTAGLVYRGTTADAIGEQEWPAPMTCASTGRIIRSVAHRLRTTHPSALYIQATPNGPGAPEVALYIHNGCTPNMAPRICALGTTRSPESANSVTGIPADTTVWIIISTYAKADGDPGGPYELTVSEAPARAVGEPCDNAALGLCGSGLTCVRDVGESVGRCAAAGTVAGAPPRTTAPACDAPLVNISGTCRTVSDEGGPCGDGFLSCRTGLTCLARNTAWRGGTCVAPGIPGGSCSVAAPCGPGLACTVTSGTDTGVCYRVVHEGEACALNVSSQCDASTACVADGAAGASTFHCAAPGSAPGTPCADATTPRGC